MEEPSSKRTRGSSTSATRVAAFLDLNQSRVIGLDCDGFARIYSITSKSSSSASLTVRPRPGSVFVEINEAVLGLRLALEDVPEQFVADFDVHRWGNIRPSANSGWP